MSPPVPVTVMPIARLAVDCRPVMRVVELVFPISVVLVA